MRNDRYVPHVAGVRTIGGKGLPAAHVDIAAVTATAVLAVPLTTRSVAAGMDHPARRRIYEHLLRLPGDHFRSIARSLNLGPGTARHHVDVLVRAGIIRAQRSRGRVRYYPNGSGSEPERNRLYMRHWRFRDPRLRVLLSVRRLTPATPSTIGRSLGISRQLAAYHLSRLEETGHVRGDGGRYKA